MGEQWIVSDPNVMMGKPVIAGTRVTVELILEKLASRIGKDGVLRVVAEDERSQHRNKELAKERLRQLVAQALHVPKPRKKTRPPRSADDKRLEEKSRRKKTKELRKPPAPEE